MKKLLLIVLAITSMASAKITWHLVDQYNCGMEYAEHLMRNGWFGDWSDTTSIKSFVFRYQHYCKMDWDSLEQLFPLANGKARERTNCHVDEYETFMNDCTRMTETPAACAYAWDRGVQAAHYQDFDIGRGVKSNNRCLDNAHKGELPK